LFLASIEGVGRVDRLACRRQDGQQSLGSPELVTGDDQFQPGGQLLSQISRRGLIAYLG
jgi:hypothetical protein